MRSFPRREADILALYDALISGYKANPGAFPRSDKARLEDLHRAYLEAKSEQTKALARAQAATDNKYAKLDALVATMKQEIAQAELNAPDDSRLASLIGLGEKAPVDPSTPPGPPRSPDTTILGPTTILLDWKAPARRSGGRVHSYCVERREADGTWSEVATTTETEATLTDQPSGRELEYRVIGENAGGKSSAGASARITL